MRNITKKSVLASTAGVTLAMAQVPAFAQSSVTLYGLLDDGLRYATHSAANGSGQVTLGTGAISSSRWGLRVVEDLGNGYKALATLENGFTPTTGALSQGGREFGRTSIVGLAGPYGTLTLGRQFTVLHDVVANNDVFGISNVYMIGASTDYIANTRLDNGVRYHFAYAGVDLELSHNLSEVGAGTFSQGVSNGATLEYDRGALHLGGGYQNAQGTHSIYGLTIANANQQNWTLGGSYKFSCDKVFISYIHNAIGIYKNNFATASIQHTFAPDITLGWVFNYDHINAGAANGNRFATGGLFTYQLSKRSSIYVEADYSKFTGLWQRVAASTAFEGGSLYGATSRIGVTVGLRHTF